MTGFGYQAIDSGEINFATDRFRVCLIDGKAGPDPAARYRADLPNEVAAEGYEAGGRTVAVTVGREVDSDTILVTFGGTTWPAPCKIFASAAIYFKDTGSAETDLLAVAITFDGQVVGCTGGPFELGASEMRLRFAPERPAAAAA